MTATAPTAIVAGSGLNLMALLDGVTWESPFGAFQQLPPPSVAGHAGTFTGGTCGGLPVILQQGRHHFYEGYGYAEVTASIRVLSTLGAERVLFTNAAGGLTPELEPGFLVSVDRIVTWPCRLWAERPPEIVPEWVVPGCDATGSYVWVHGPSYETRAEIAALQHKGAAAVGMSTAPEMTAAQSLGMRTAAISCITNNCCRIEHLTHAHVLATSRQTSEKLCALLRRALPLLGERS